MDVEIYLHGVPDGQDYFGIKEEQTNAGLFYDNSTESVKLVVETKKNGDKAYTYYTYLRYKGIVGSGGRPGSYFGITLRLDMYYQDVIHIYTLLEIVFKKYIIGTLLAQSGDTYKYMVPSFSVKKAEIEQLQQGMIQLIQSTCVFSKFTNIDDSFIHPATNVATCNIADISDSSMLSAIKKYSKVALSPDYKLNLAKEYEKKIQEAEGKGGNIVVEKEKIINSLNATISSQNSKIAKLEQDIKSKENELAQNKQRIDVKQTVETIKEPIIKLSKFFRLEDEGHTQKAYDNSAGNDQSIKKALTLNIALLAVVLILCVIGLFRTPSNSNNKQLDAQVAELTTTNQKLLSDKSQLEANIKSLQDALASKSNEIARLKDLVDRSSKNNQPAPTTQKIQLKIDVEGYSRGALSTDKNYTISIRKADKSVYNDGGEWIITGATITNGSIYDSKITIQPDGTNNVSLKFDAYDTNCTCNVRDFIIEKPQTTEQTNDPKNQIQPSTANNKLIEQSANNGTTTPNITDKDNVKNAPKDKTTENPVTSVVDNQTDTQVTTKTGTINQPEQEIIIVITPDEKEVIKGNEYTFSITGYDGEGKWELENGLFKGSSKATDKIVKVKIRQSREGSPFTITYTPKGKQPIKREFTIKKNE